MLYSFFLIMKNVGCSSAFRPRYPNIYYRTFEFLKTPEAFLDKSEAYPPMMESTPK